MKRKNNWRCGCGEWNLNSEEYCMSCKKSRKPAEPIVDTISTGEKTNIPPLHDYKKD